MSSVFCYRLRLLAAALIMRSAIAHGQVIVNEVSSASNERLLQWTASGAPRLGSGIPWNASNFPETGWLSGALPAGWGSAVSTNLQTAMQNKTPSLYLRKSFTVSAAQAASVNPVVLQVDYDDGFVAYLNGVEVARYNCGAAGQFLYAAQTAYNVATPSNTAVSSGVIEVTLGNASALLLTGTNVLSIEARNYNMSSNFRINAGVKLITSTTPIALTNALYDLNGATGATRTHTNTTSTTNTASGTPQAGGWLATAADPASDDAWTSLQIITGEQPADGVGGTGGLLYTITQSGTNLATSMRAPQVTMTNSWAPSGVTPATLASTTVRFRYRTTGDMQFGFRCDPGVTQAANSVDGFPVIGAPFGGTADYDWNTVTNAIYGATIDASGGQTTTLGGSINLANYELNIGPGCRSGQVTLTEDSSLAAGPGGLSWTFNTFPTTVDSLGFGILGLKVPEWVAGAITLTDFQRTRLSFRWKMPAGRKQAFFLENKYGGSAAERAQLGIFTGTGNWETYSASLSAIPSAEALRAMLNGNSATETKLTGYLAGVNFSNGESVQLDTLNLYKEATGTPVDENTPNTFGAATGGSRTRTITAGGAVSDTTTGTLANSITLNSDPSATGFVFRVVEDSAAGAGNGGSTGFLRCEVTDAPDIGAPWGFSLPGVTVRNWTVGAITTQQLSDVSLRFAAKLPAGVTFTVYAEPTGGSTANRANLGTLTGNGTWQTVTREFSTAANVANFRTALNTGTTTTFQLTFTGPTSATLGDQLSLDDVQVMPWRSYQVTLSQGTNQQRFMDTLNAGGSIAFVPEFVKNTAAPAGGGSLAIDDFAVDYSGADPNAFQTLIATGAAGGNWKYFVGLAEPSGGLFDPSLLTGFTPPVGEEEEFDNPTSFRDWVELRNLGGSAVNLAGWALTDDSAIHNKWLFPSGTTIPANGYLIVMCDEREAANGTATYVHANFSLSSTGEYIGLYNATGTLQSEVTGMPEQDTFHSWGRNPAGTADFGYLDTATPGAANTGNIFSNQVKTPDFYKADGITSFSGGFYAGAQILLLTCATSGATIRYTTDGSDPTETTGTVYSGPITLTPPADHKSALVIRTRAFKSGLVKSNSKTHTYLLDLNANLRGVPALILSGDAGRSIFAPHGIMAIVGGTYPGSVWTANGPASYNLAIGRGDTYERSIHAEWYYPDGRDGWREEVGLRIASSPYSRPYLQLNQTALSPWIRDHTQKPSFNLYWRGDYGNSTVKDPNLIPGNDVNDYARLRIRAGKNDIANPFIIDESGRRLYRDMGWVQPTGTINTLYMNGSFKGLYNACERLRGPTFQLHYRTDNEFDVRYIGEQVDGDATFWNSMQTALNTLNSSPTLANYQAVQNYLDVTNVADYFLHNIYVNNNDWPGNNWAAQRERSAAGRYRMAEWDVEGAFGLFGQPVNYNTIDEKLLNSSSECGDIFKRLYQSPEFKLLMADRINRHMWNGGVLDDRGSTDHFQQVIDSLVAQTQPLITFIENQTLSLNWYNSHIDPTTGRRTYLFGTGAGNFRSKGLWPVTVPPTFSQFGGIVPAGYPLVLSSATGGTIYYTIDGTDPRLAGGAVSPPAQTYGGPVTLNNLVTVKSRVKSAGGEWSAITEAYFEPNAAQPTAATLAVAELMYNPPSESAAEITAGFTNSDDFEFVRLANIGATPLDLRNLRFTVGITFDFSLGSVLAINPGASVLVVADKDAFRARYGTGYDGMIAGEYGGSFSNSGEQLALVTVGGAAVTIANFTFDDQAPWPEAADGYGPSLMLIAPATAPNPAVAANWTASAQPGGMPGGTPRTLTYTAWKQLCFDSTDAANAAISGPTADPDGDGLSNRAEYGLGGVPRFPDGSARNPISALEVFAGHAYLTLQYNVQSGASEATLTPEVSSDLTVWNSGVVNLTNLAGPTTSPTGYVSWKTRDNTATDQGTKRFIHLKITTP